jgi:hypothetical protein
MILPKNAKRMCIFHNEWLLKCVWLKQVPNDNSRIFCKVLHKLFAMSQGGENDIQSMVLEHSTNNSIIRSVKVSCYL